MSKKIKIFMFISIVMIASVISIHAFAATSPKIEKTIDKWENITPNKISTSIVGKCATNLSTGEVVPFRLTMEVPAMQKLNDETLACRAIITDTLPSSMDFNDGSLHVYVNNSRVPSTAYTVSVSGHKIKITMNGINKYPFNAEEGDELVVTYNAVVNDDITFKNTNTASVKYDYGTFTRTVTDKKDEYSVYVCQYCGYRAFSQSEITEHQKLFIYTDGIDHSMARGLVYDYSDWIYEESKFMVEKDFTLQSNETKASIYTFTLKFNNVDTNGNVVSGAGYTLYKKNATGKYQKVSQISGTTSFHFSGLTIGEYKLVQSITPNGYNKVGDLEFTISASGNDIQLSNLKASGWNADFETGTLSRNIVNTIKSATSDNTKTLSATVKYMCGTTLKDTRIITETIHSSETTLSTNSITAKTYSGWKLNNITVNGVVVSSLPAKVKSNATIVFNYVADVSPSQLKATVQYNYGGTTRYTETLTKVVLSSSGTNVLSTDGITEKSEQGWKLSHITVNGAVRSLPQTVTNGSIIIYHYIIDTAERKTLSATVEYKKDDSIIETKSIYSTVQYLSDDTISTNAMMREYLGYEIDYITVDGKLYSSLPKTVNNGAKVVINYTTDYSQKRTNKATIYKSFDGTIQDSETFNLTDEVQILSSETLISTHDIEIQEYNGWDLKNITINGKKVTSLPDYVKHGDSIVFYYETAQMGITVLYLDEQENEIADRQFISGSYGDYYNTEQKEITGYDFVSSSGNTRGNIYNNDIVIYRYAAKESSILVKYFDKSGKSVSPSETIRGKYGEPYDIKPKEISGYICTGDTGNTIGKFGSNQTVIIFDYEVGTVVKTATVTVKYVDEDGNNLTHPVEITGNVGDYYSTEMKDFVGYTYISNSGNTTGTIEEGITVKYIYKKLESTVKISYQDEQGNELSPPVITQGQYGNTYNTFAKDIEGYELIGNSGNISGKFGTENIDVIYIYRKIITPITLTVQYVDEDGNKLAETEEQTGYNGDIYNTNPKDILGYTLKITPDNFHGILSENTIVTYIYQKKDVIITVNYVDEDGHNLSETKTITKKYGEGYSVYAINITGYKLKETIGDTIGTVPVENTQITFVYTLDESQTKSVSATVKYYFNGVETETYILENTIHVLSKDSKLSTNGVVKFYEGYGIKNIEINEETVDIMPEKINNGDIINLYYESAEVVVTVLYQDEDGSEIASLTTISGKFNDNYSTVPKEIKGYILKSDSDNTSGIMNKDITVIYTYEKVKTTVTVRYTDEYGNDLINPEVLSGEFGDEYSTYAKEFDEYILISGMDHISGNFGEKDIEIIYTYDRRNAFLVTKFVDENGTEIAQNETIVCKYGDDYNSYAKEIYGYELISDNSVSGTIHNYITEITFTYTVKDAIVIVKFVDDKTGYDISPSEIINSKMFSLYETESKTISGWKLKEIPENSFGKINEEETIVVYRYTEDVVIENPDIPEKPTYASLTVKYMDVNGNEIIPSKNSEYEVGTWYNTESIIIDGYELLNNPENASGVLDKSTTVIYIYQKTEDKKDSQVIVKFVDLNGNSISESNVITGKVGDSYQTQVKMVDGYEFLYTNGSENGVMSEYSTIVIYVYKKFENIDVPEEKPVNGNKVTVHISSSDITSIQIYNYNYSPIVYNGVTYNTGNLIAVIPVDNNIATIIGLPKGDYCWREYKTINGFSKNKNYYPIKTNDDVEIPEIKVENGKIKISEINGMSLTDTRFELRNIGENAVNYNGTIINSQEVLTTFTGNHTEFTVSGIPYGTYELRQINTIDGYLDTSIYTIIITDDVAVDVIITLPTHNHEWDNGRITSASTCTEEGIMVYTCNVCGEEITEKIDILNHNLYEKKATVEEEGYIKCHNCDFTQIVPKLTSNNFDIDYIQLEFEEAVYTGKMIKPSVTIMSVDGKEIPKSCYSVSYSNNINVGIAKVKVVFNGEYSGIITKTFNIIPDTTDILSITSVRNGFTVRWNKQMEQTDGYELEYATNSDFSDAVTIKIDKNTTIAKNINGVSSDNQYYVRIRTCNGEYKSSWSEIKTITLK